MANRWIPIDGSWWIINSWDRPVQEIWQRICNKIHIWYSAPVKKSRSYKILPEDFIVRFIRGWVSNRGKGLILQQMLLVSFDQHHKDHGFSRSTTLWYSYAVWQGRTATTVRPPMATTIPSPKDWGSILSVEFIPLFVIGIATGACSGSGIIHPIILSTSERVPNLCKPLLNHGLWQFMAVYSSLWGMSKSGEWGYRMSIYSTNFP